MVPVPSLDRGTCMYWSSMHNGCVQLGPQKQSIACNREGQTIQITNSKAQENDEETISKNRTRSETELYGRYFWWVSALCECKKWRYEKGLLAERCKPCFKLLREHKKQICLADRINHLHVSCTAMFASLPLSGTAVFPLIENKGIDPSGIVGTNNDIKSTPWRPFVRYIVEQARASWYANVVHYWTWSANAVPPCLHFDENLRNEGLSTIQHSVNSLYYLHV